MGLLMLRCWLPLVGKLTCTVCGDSVCVGGICMYGTDSLLQDMALTTPPPSSPLQGQGQQGATAATDQVAGDHVGHQSIG